MHLSARSQNIGKMNSGAIGGYSSDISGVRVGGSPKSPFGPQREMERRRGGGEALCKVCAVSLLFWHQREGGGLCGERRGGHRNEKMNLIFFASNREGLTLGYIFQQKIVSLYFFVFAHLWLGIEGKER